MCFEFVNVLGIVYWRKCQLSDIKPDMIITSTDAEGINIEPCAQWTY